MFNSSDPIDQSPKYLRDRVIKRGRSARSLAVGSSRTERVVADPDEDPRVDSTYRIRRRRGAGRTQISFWPLGFWLSLGLALIVYSVGGMETDPPEKPVRAAAPLSQVQAYDFDSQVWSLAFSPDGARIAGATIAGDLWLADETGGSLRVRIGGQGSLRSIAFSPDGQSVALAGALGAVRILDADSGIERQVIELAGKQTSRIAFSGDGKYLAVGGHGGCLFVWNLVTARCEAPFTGHKGGISALEFSPESSALFAGDTFGDLRVWDVATGRTRFCFRAHQPGTGGVVALAISRDGEMLAMRGLFEPVVRLWNAATGEARGTLPAPEFGASALAFSSAYPLLAIAGRDGCTRLWNFRTARECGSVQASGRALDSVVFSKDGKRFATGGMDATARVWDIDLALGH